MDFTTLNKDRKTGARRKVSMDISTMALGKIPPQARELEETVLGAIMLEKRAFDTVIAILKWECFYVDAHQKIFKAFMNLADKEMPIDILTVCEQLKKEEDLELVGGAYFVTKLTNSVVSAANIETHARIILQKFIQRELIRVSGEIITDAYEDATDVFDLMDNAEEKIFDITNNFLKDDTKEMSTALAEAIARIDDLRLKTDDISGVPTGFVTLDKITYGWQPTDLIILAARPSVGKTAFALNLARNAALNPIKPVPVAFFSLEMSASQLVTRILSAESEIMMEKIVRGKLDNKEYELLQKNGIKRLENAKIYIDDNAALNIFEFRAKARRLVQKNNVGLIIIDYLQLMTGSNERNGNREQEISGISRNLKQLAKELKVPIIALSQLSRAVETRKETNKTPQLSDLRESGAIEQDADMVMFLYRPEYHNIHSDENGESNKGHTEIKIAKHRNGDLGTVNLKAELWIQRFYDQGLKTEGSNGFNPNNFNQRSLQANPNNSFSDEGRLYVQKGSKMNDMNVDDFDQPF